MGKIEHVDGYTRKDGTVVHAYTREHPFAIGLPDKHKITELPTCRAGKWIVAVQLHRAERAGTHYDLRLVDPATGIAHSWAIPRAELPGPGKKVLAVRQPDHTADYIGWSGSISSGYGKGSVTALFSKKTDLIYASPDAIKFNLYDGKVAKELSLVRTEGNNWLLVNVTPALNTRVPAHKDSYKSIAFDKIDVNNKDEILQPKYDGAHVIVDAQAGKQVRVYSYRRRTNGSLIEHTFKFRDDLGFYRKKEAASAVFRAELVAVSEDGIPLPAHKLSGILNSDIDNAIQTLERTKARLIAIPFDILSYNGRGMLSRSYEERLSAIISCRGSLPSFMMFPQLAVTPEQKKTLISEVISGIHPFSKEGVIVWSRRGSLPKKAKKVDDFDVFVTDVYEAKDKNGKGVGRAGGFTYSWYEGGRAVGRVGSGLSHELARDMLANKDKYIGRVAKVTSQEILVANTGKNALRSPAFKGWHLDKGRVD